MPTKIDFLFPFNIVLEILASTQMTRTRMDIKIKKENTKLPCVNDITVENLKVKLFKPIKSSARL